MSHNFIKNILLLFGFICATHNLAAMDSKHFSGIAYKLLDDDDTDNKPAGNKPENFFQKLFKKKPKKQKNSSSAGHDDKKAATAQLTHESFMNELKIIEKYQEERTEEFLSPFIKKSFKTAINTKLYKIALFIISRSCYEQYLELNALRATSLFLDAKIPHNLNPDLETSEIRDMKLLLRWTLARRSKRERAEKEKLQAIQDGDLSII